MTRHVIALHGTLDRQRAVLTIAAAPPGSIVEVRAPGRTKSQNSLMWELCTQLSVAKPQGIRKTPESWKCALMHACGHQVQFEAGLDGEPFPIGFRSSRLSKRQMTDLIEFIFAYAAEQGIVLSTEAEAA
jgi:hypothetical protein